MENLNNSPSSNTDASKSIFGANSGKLIFLWRICYKQNIYLQVNKAVPRAIKVNRRLAWKATNLILFFIRKSMEHQLTIDRGVNFFRFGRASSPTMRTTSSTKRFRKLLTQLFKIQKTCLWSQINSKIWFAQ